MAERVESITVEGDETLARTLGDAEEDLRTMEQLENARLVAQRAQTRAPARTGTLRGSIRAKATGAGVAVAYSELVYAPVIHYGWAAHGIRANPFLTSAAEDSVQLVQARSLREANTILGKVKGA